MKLMTYAPLLAGALGLALSASALARDDKKETPKVEEGKPAPALELAATQIEKVLPNKKDAKTLSLKDFQGEKGKTVVLFFFPKAKTRGWTIECCGFRDRAEQFAQLDAVLIGISTDKLEDQQDFTEKEKLSYPLMADPDQKAAKAFAVLNPKGYANRTTFVIDKKGVVRKIYDKVDFEKHPEEVLKYVKENLADKK